MSLISIVRLVDEAAGPGAFQNSALTIVGIGVASQLTKTTREIWKSSKPWFELFTYGVDGIPRFDPNNAWNLAEKKVLGAGAFFLADKGIPGIRAFARLVLVAERIKYCLQKRKDFRFAYEQWIQAVRGDYPRAVLNPLSKKTSTLAESLLGPSTAFWLTLKRHAFLTRTEKILTTTASLFKECEMAACVAHVV